MPSRKGAPGAPWTGAMAAVRPMLASLADFGEVPLRSDSLIYEPKYDGIRALVSIEPPGSRPTSHGPRPTAQGPRPTAHGPRPEAHGGQISIWSRNGLDKTAQFPELVRAFGAVAAKRRAALLLDGEIVALDAQGRPQSFTRLQPRIHASGAKAITEAMAAHPVAFVAFDLLRDGDEDLRRLPLTARRLRLERAFRPPARSPLRLSEFVERDAHALVTRAKREGWEGVVAKAAASVYETGRRSAAWRKLKLLKRQEFIVGGWTEGRRSRAHFGALLLGVHAGTQGPRPKAQGSRPKAHGPRPKAHGLIFVGSVGSGFDEEKLAKVAALLRAREVHTSPFAEAIKLPEPIHWVKPDLVVEVKYTEFTPDGRLRHPVYLGLRDDKGSSNIVLEGPGKARQDSSKLSAIVNHLRELEDARKDGWLDLPDGHRLHVTNLWKVFWPELKITKGDVLRYYVEVSPFILPAVADRPLVMKRFPNGVAGKAFYQQRVLDRPPPGVRVESLPEGLDPIRDEEEVRNPQRFVGGSLTTLLYMAQMAAISQDPWFSTIAAPLEADQVAIDLDPGEGVAWRTVLDVARWVRDEMERLRIPGVPKTSGSRGVHIYVPLPRGTSYETGLLLCQLVATIVSSKHPKYATVERMVARRPKGTVYVDYLQNILGKTLATAYSARASDYAGVSTPLTWREVDEGIDARDFTIRTAPARFREAGDLWSRRGAGARVDLHAVMDRIGKV